MGYSQVRIKSHWLYLALLLSVLAILAHKWMPQKQLNLLKPNTKVSLFMDSQTGGTSTGDWIDEPHRQFLCHFDNVQNQYNYCGFNVQLGDGLSHGINISDYRALKIKLRYRGHSELLRIYFRNFSEGLSSETNVTKTAKYISMLVPTRDLNKELVLPLNQFTLADWWIRDMRLPTEFAYSEFDNIVHLGVDFPYPIIAGDHDITVEKMELVGGWISRENWYLSILGFWFLLLALTNLLQYLRYHHMLTLSAQELHKERSKAHHLEEQSNHYRALSMLDQLTETLNRRGIERQYQLLQLAERWTGTALIFLDIDHFKRINDVFGHETGDQVLAAVAGILRSELRGHDEIGRWGGEEFLLICPGVTLEQARNTAEKIRIRIENERFAPPHRLRLTISIGVTMAMPKESFETTFRRVDKAMYSAKQQGRNRLVANIVADQDEPSVET